MKAAIEIAPLNYQITQSAQPAIAWPKLAGLLVAAGFPTLFWVAALALVGHAVGVSMSASTLLGFGLSIGATCLLGASLVTADPGHHHYAMLGHPCRTAPSVEQRP